MSTPASSRVPTGADARLDRACWVAALALTVAWFLVFNPSRPDYLVDEGGHLGNVYHLLEGKPGWPEQMTMLPGYHAVVALLWQLHPPCSLLTLARLVSLMAALFAGLGFGWAWRRLQGRPAGPMVLLFALLPILQPFTALAYTELPALALALLGVAAQISGRRALAALALVGAMLVRQTSVIWVVFLLGLTWCRADQVGRDRRRDACWLGSLLAACGVAAALAWGVAGRLTPGTQTGNELHFNPANLHLGGLLALLLGLPLWLAQLPSAARGLRGAWSARPAMTLGLAGLALALAGVLAAGFANPHAWNRELRWEGVTFTLLRNWPLVALEGAPWLRFVSGLNVVAMAGAVGWAVWRQPRRGELAWALVCGLAVPLTNGLAEPRYWLPLAAMVLLLVDFPAAAGRRLVLWWALLCLVHAPWIALGRSLW